MTKTLQLLSRNFNYTIVRSICNKWKPALYGMIHVLPMPGSPLWKGEKISYIVDRALREAEMYKNYNFSGVIIENMFDVPYLKQSDIEPQTLSIMTIIANEVRKILRREEEFQIGIQVLSAANEEAMAIALAADCDFIRVEGFVFAHIGDEGYTESCAGKLLRFRKRIGAEKIKVYCDIKKKHSSHAITGDTSTFDHVQAADFFCADGIILTGKHTGDPAKTQELHELKEKTALPILIGSGINAENLSSFKEADGFIVGSYFKRNTNWKNELTKDRLSTLITNMETIKNKREK